jgi:hypothetical protein
VQYYAQLLFTLVVFASHKFNYNDLDLDNITMDAYYPNESKLCRYECLDIGGMDVFFYTNTTHIPRISDFKYSTWSNVSFLDGYTWFPKTHGLYTFHYKSDIMRLTCLVFHKLVNRSLEEPPNKQQDLFDIAIKICSLTLARKKTFQDFYEITKDKPDCWYRSANSSKLDDDAFLDEWVVSGHDILKNIANALGPTRPRGTGNDVLSTLQYQGTSTNHGKSKKQSDDEALQDEMDAKAYRETQNEPLTPDHHTNRDDLEREATELKREAAELENERKIEQQKREIELQQRKIERKKRKDKAARQEEEIALLQEKSEKNRANLNRLNRLIEDKQRERSGLQQELPGDEKLYAANLESVSGLQEKVRQTREKLADCRVRDNGEISGVEEKWLLACQQALDAADALENYNQQMVYLAREEVSELERVLNESSSEDESSSGGGDNGRKSLFDEINQATIPEKAPSPISTQADAIDENEEIRSADKTQCRRTTNVVVKYHVPTADRDEIKSAVEQYLQSAMHQWSYDVSSIVTASCD